MEQAAEMKHKQSAYILVPTLAGTQFVFHLSCLCSVLFIVLPTNAENFNFFLTFVYMNLFAMDQGTLLECFCLPFLQLCNT